MNKVYYFAFFDDDEVVDEGESDSLWFPTYAFDSDFEICVSDYSSFGAQCWRRVARSASYRGVSR